MRRNLSRDDLRGLERLTARATHGTLDPAIALLDGWACLSEILGFYLERAVDEAYLRTCTELASAVAIANLVGYRPRAGVAADAWLAFALDDLDREAVLEIPVGTRAYSRPGPGEVMQPFETVEPLQGRPRWSRMRPRLSRPQWLVSPRYRADGTGPLPQIVNFGAEIWFAGVAAGLKAGDLLVFEFERGGRLGLPVATAELFPPGAQPGIAIGDKGRTRVVLQGGILRAAADAAATRIAQGAVDRLVARPGNVTTSREALVLDPGSVFAARAAGAAAMLASARPELRASLADAVGSASNDRKPRVTVSVMRIRAAIHGHNAPLRPILGDGGNVAGYEEWSPEGDGGVGDAREKSEPDLRVVALDAEYEGILPGSQVVIVRRLAAASEVRPLRVGRDQLFTVQQVRSESRTTFAMPARVTVLVLDRKWRASEVGFSELRNTVIYAKCEPLVLADRPDDSAVEGDRIELDGYYPGLEPPRRVIVSGERNDIPGVTGVQGSELAMVAGVSHDVIPNSVSSMPDTVHTTLLLTAPGLQFGYRRDTVTVFGNVAHATHGESRVEVLGDGNASRRLQEFVLKQPPITYVSAPTPSGIATTLQVSVNDLRWREAPDPAASVSGERSYVVRTTSAEETTVVTGFGARPATGRGNIRARYRSGLGRAGNVRAHQIEVLGSQPLGVTGVSNPMPATGGADRDGLAQVRARAPIGLAALDRLISTSDFEDFVRDFAGIGKARIWRADPRGRPTVIDSAGPGEFVVTIAGEGDIPIGADSALLRNLTAALAAAGDLLSDGPGRLKTRSQPALRIRVRIRDAALVVLRARVRIGPEYAWETIRPRIAATLDAHLGFDARELGEPLDPGIAIAAIQRVRGVEAVDMQGFGAVDVTSRLGADALATVAERARSALAAGIAAASTVAPGTIVYLAADARGTLLLSEWEGRS
ncbi:MAG TPA: baseplate J/gp47 family protein [Arachnia sp.]|nr:baseplate J/gp47 family protein [Arachnia sp.]HMR12276.1 baseplate J/gp47 family protein [Arachnia sp.]